ncbi:hypothetical protein H5410_014340 [Solanum commersonii]|uniref:Uncharacterized protein n=1 Tax=Solanum commersonii TaxID=4109 RepID=A0A9J5ZR40_SOLCO|nr:hypothetical protein H5410_014340 [Solanum commersonii]
MSAKHIIDQVQLMRGKKGSMIRQIYMYMMEVTIEHLIIQCQFARKLWERLFTWIHHHSEIILAEGVYGVWIERNNRIFLKKNKMEESVAKEIAYVTIAPDNIKNVVNEFKF